MNRGVSLSCLFRNATDPQAQNPKLEVEVLLVALDIGDLYRHVDEVRSWMVFVQSLDPYRNFVVLRSLLPRSYLSVQAKKRRGAYDPGSVLDCQEKRRIQARDV